MVESRKSFSESAILRAFGARVRKLRLERTWSQEVLMERARLDRSYLSQLENGKRNVSLVVIAQIASAFSIEIKDLFDDYDDDGATSAR